MRARLGDETVVEEAARSVGHLHPRLRGLGVGAARLPGPARRLLAERGEGGAEGVVHGLLAARGVPVDGGLPRARRRLLRGHVVEDRQPESEVGMW